MFAINNENVKKKVYIFAGNEREGLQGTYHNIGWEIANNWEENLKWEEKFDHKIIISDDVISGLIAFKIDKNSIKTGYETRRWGQSSGI